MSYDTRPRDNTDQPEPVESREEHEVFEETRPDQPEATLVETEPETDRAPVQEDAAEAPIHAETGDPIDDQHVSEEVSSEALVTDEAIADEPVAEADVTSDEPAAQADDTVADDPVAQLDEPAAEAGFGSDEPSAQVDDTVADESVAQLDEPAAEAVVASDEPAADADEVVAQADEPAADESDEAVAEESVAQLDEPAAEADQAAADAFAASDEAVAQADESVTDDEAATTLWPQDTISDLRVRWQAVQLRFVDDPPAVAAEMQVLVGEAVQALSTVVADRQRELDSWNEGSDTEELRIAAQRYRDFFDFVLGR